MASTSEVRQRLKEIVAEAASGEDRYIRGTKIDDVVINVLRTLGACCFIVFLIGVTWLAIENQVTPRALHPWRVYVPSIFMIGMMFFSRPFLQLGWWGWGFVVVQSIVLMKHFFMIVNGV